MNKQPNSDHCFVCGVRNVAGVQVAFYETPGADGRIEVVGRFTGKPVHQGYPGRMHGGVVGGILDEVMARCLTVGEEALAPPVWGVSVELTVRYHQPVPLGVELSARGRITRDSRRLFEASGELYLPDGRVAASATGKYVKLALGAIADGDPATLGWRVYED